MCEIDKYESTKHLAAIPILLYAALFNHQKRGTHSTPPYQVRGLI